MGGEIGVTGVVTPSFNCGNDFDRLAGWEACGGEGGVVAGAVVVGIIDGRGAAPRRAESVLAWICLGGLFSIAEVRTPRCGSGGCPRSARICRGGLFSIAEARILLCGSGKCREGLGFWLRPCLAF